MCRWFAFQDNLPGNFSPRLTLLAGYRGWRPSQSAAGYGLLEPTAFMALVMSLGVVLNVPVMALQLMVKVFCNVPAARRPNTGHPDGDLGPALCRRCRVIGAARVVEFPGSAVWLRTARPATIG
jgi:hypothetical protein